MRLAQSDVFFPGFHPVLRAGSCVSAILSLFVAGMVFRPAGAKPTTETTPGHLKLEKWGRKLDGVSGSFDGSGMCFEKKQKRKKTQKQEQTTRKKTHQMNYSRRRRRRKRIIKSSLMRRGRKRRRR